ncbi:hypothetical protein D3C81_1190560 [compost metagenome]
MLVYEGLLPANGIVERPVKAFGLLTVCSTIGGVRSGELGRHKIAVVEILQARRRVEGIGYVKRQFNFRIENGIKYRIPFVQFEIFLLKIIVITALAELLAEWILQGIAVGIGIIGVRAVAQCLIHIDIDVTVGAVLKIHIGAQFQPVGYMRIDFHVGAGSLVCITDDGTLIFKVPHG